MRLILPQFHRRQLRSVPFFLQVIRLMKLASTTFQKLSTVSVRLIHRITQSVGARGRVHKGNVISKNRQLALTRHFCSNSILAMMYSHHEFFKRLPSHLRQDQELIESIIVAPVQPTASNCITNLLFFQISL